MAQSICCGFNCLFRKWGHVILAFCWVAGLLFGLRLFCDAGTVSLSLMPMAVSGHVSIVGLLISVFLPFLFAAFAVYICQPVILCIICHVKAICLAFASCGVSNCFGSAGWLIWLLFMFHDICASVVLYLFAQRHISGVRSLDVMEILVVCGINALLIAMEYHILSPFLMELIL